MGVFRSVQIQIPLKPINHNLSFRIGHHCNHHTKSKGITMSHFRSLQLNSSGVSEIRKKSKDLGQLEIGFNLGFPMMYEVQRVSSYLFSSKMCNFGSHFASDCKKNVHRHSKR